MTKLLGSPDLDLFPTRLNTHLSRFSSWKPDPEAEFVNAFSKSWSDLFYFLFPPFFLGSRCLQTIQRDRAQVLLIVPLWPTQLWYPMLMGILIDYPICLTHTQQKINENSRNGKNTSSSQSVKSNCMSIVRTNLENEGISDKAFKIILASWRSSTKKTICYIHPEMALVL